MNDASNEAIIERIAARYRLRRHRSYVRGKLHWDPLFAEVAPLLVASARPLLDIGCGLGLMGQYLREHGFRAPFLGLDLDAIKVEAAKAAAALGGLGIEFMTGSAAALPMFRGDVALFDVLHYMTADEQRRAIADAGERVAPGGVLLIRNVLREPGWRFRATLLEEKLARALGWMRCATRHFPDRTDIEAPLRSMGFATHVAPLWGHTPFNSYLFVARRGIDGDT